MIRKLGLSIGASTIALCTPAMAQDEASERIDRESSGDQDAIIVVTAQKREERLQDVPINVNVVGADQLDRQNVTDTVSLADAVPSLTIAGGSIGGPQIRGIGTSTFARSAETSVSTVLDGVVLDRNRATELYDVERVEVLNGPQGTLFGKNASAGLINIVSRKPDLSRFSVYGKGDVGNRDYRDFEAAINVPFSPTLGIRVAGHYNSYGNTIFNPIVNKADFTETASVRGQIRWEPTPSFTANLLGAYTKIATNGVNGSVGPLRTILPATGNPGGTPDLTGTNLAAYNLVTGTLAAQCGVAPDPRNNIVCQDGVNPTTGGNLFPSSFRMFALQLDWDVGPATLTSITAHRRFAYGNSMLPAGTPGNDADSTPFPILSSNLSDGRTSTFSQELRVATPADEPISFVAGLYGSWQDSDQGITQTGTVFFNPSPTAPLLSRGNTFNITQRNYGIFGQVDFDLTEQLKAFVGGRYTHDYLRDVTELIVVPGFIALPPSQQFREIDITDKRDNLSWRAGLQFYFTPDVQIYGSVARGYKGSLINDGLTNSSIGQTLVEPEKPLAFELGLKASVLDNRLGLNIALFHTEVDNYQTTVFLPPDASGRSGFATGNASSVRTRGVDLSIFGRPFDGFTVNAGVLYNDSSYADDFRVACSQLFPPGQSGCGTDGTTSPVDRLVFAPEWKASVSGQYETNLFGNVDGFVQGDLVYTSSFFYTPTPDPNTIAPSYTKLGGRIGIKSSDGFWTLSVFGRNLLDERIPQYVIPDPLSARNGLGGRSYVQQFDVNSYRIIGVSLGFEY